MCTRMSMHLSFLRPRNSHHVRCWCVHALQAVRNAADLAGMACPPKYRDMQTFYKYFSGERQAPILTIFIGGNHEASAHLCELPYGGWVAPNIFYLGFAGVVTVGGVRIGGLSGIYKEHDYRHGHHERPPFSDDEMRSFYHVREIDVLQLRQLRRPLDIFLSHDWPQHIAKHGNTSALLRRKPFLKAEIANGSLGSPPALELLRALQPAYWYATAPARRMFRCIIALNLSLSSPRLSLNLRPNPTQVLSALARQIRRRRHARGRSAHSFPCPLKVPAQSRLLASI